ncbi:MAG: hypothetical protein KGI00_02650 [Candidatus Micrarchaeota archaeon]|nr:hypothetical protein [Candidatus Micrarchaeota archaeon]MDE1824461.1 hypothetical protein [Candidatus Micrarchaeota archaeon]MDE1849606.1 hypothetical protein [Candidatus Micrarchaeota archaeon]
MDKAQVFGIIVVLVILAALAIFLANQNPASHKGLGLLSVLLTDPPQVPNGTQALVISYSSLGVHTEGAQGSGWIQSNASGTVNLLSLLNLTQTIGTVSVPNGTQVNLVRFSVSSAKITINNITYNVTVPSGMVQANVEGMNHVSSSSGVLVSLSPTVVSILTSNTTVFVLVPSLRAVIIANGTNQSTARVGFKSRLHAEDRDSLEHTGSNITVTNASLTVSGNVTDLSVTVRNNGNQSVALKHVAIFGNVSTMLNSTAIGDNAARVEAEFEDQLRNSTICANITSNSTVNASASANKSANLSVGARPMFDLQGSGQGNDGANASANLTSNMSGRENSGNQSKQQESDHVNLSASDRMNVNNSDFGDMGEHLQSNLGLRINGSVCTAAGFAEFQDRLRARLANATSDFAHAQADFRLVSFLVAQNGTLELPYNFEDFNDTGYSLQPSSSFTFTFSNVIVTSDGGLVIKPLPGSAYRIRVGGEEGASASTNLTATAG